MPVIDTSTGLYIKPQLASVEVQCVCASREGHPSKRCFTPNQIEGLVGRIHFAALRALWHASGNKHTPTQTNKHTHTVLFLFLFLDFFHPLFGSVLFCYFEDYFMHSLKQLSACRLQQREHDVLLFKPQQCFPSCTVELDDTDRYQFMYRNNLSI